ncbi:hypothetical protein DFR59_103271 [Falsibacillus pallidus]|uniref:Uncharacterized protein n=1 Tax=Falsibacillus pallidus TaxID=493781 RepID=A0A370GQF8_9BACI|nr:hypothetical protein DFR59_103271 [Falsibacillus pallidus]
MKTNGLMHYQVQKIQRDIFSSSDTFFPAHFSITWSPNLFNGHIMHGEEG